MNFRIAFSRIGKSLKMVEGPGKSWKSVYSSQNKFFLKGIEEQLDGKIHQHKKKLNVHYGSWKKTSCGLEKSWKFVSVKRMRTLVKRLGWSRFTTFNCDEKNPRHALHAKSWLFAVLHF